MTRIKRGYVARKHRKNILKITSGFIGTHSKLFRTANQKALKSLVYSYKDRLKRKRNMRRLWICRINAIVREKNISYSNLMNLFYQNKILLNRKIIAQIAVLDKPCFDSIIEPLIKN
uniref:Large ribosomal subunit protein bL20c n=1 Tax=Coleochaete scutata TaxID=3125 RepID=A0A191T5M6_COLSC|nr:ribosomal protein L20 [Coleochaete scutata]ANI25700.1 ribosomal protein L20 [Coleochaete scutata]